MAKTLIPLKLRQSTTNDVAGVSKSGIICWLTMIGWLSDLMRIRSLMVLRYWPKLSVRQKISVCGF
jgi:hypothetical protein